LRILILCHSLGYGGAESYAVRIARGLDECGHHVGLLTEGGPLASHLEGSGVELIEAGLSIDRLDRAAKSLRGEGYQVINSQHYRSARIGARLAGELGMGHVMTVHARRNLFGRMMFRSWTPKVITVSPAVADSLDAPFGVPRDRIHVSLLPIDTTLYRPGGPVADPPEAWGEDGGCRIILHISRLEYRKVRPALALVGAMPSILDCCPKARLLIVGVGRGAERVQEAVSALSAERGDVARLLEPRPDVSPLYRLAELTVATGLVARESLACGCPVVAAGRLGHLGVVDGATFEEADRANFGDLAECPEPISAEAMARDVGRVLEESGRFGAEAARLAELVAARYGLRAAAEDVEPVLREAARDDGR
jgi:glycosyltransferase involved in cell wall biosynthesis